MKASNNLTVLIIWFVLLGSGCAGTQIERSVVRITTLQTGEDTAESTAVERTGAGVIWSCDEEFTYILTAFHVIKGSRKVSVEFYKPPVTSPGEFFEGNDRDDFAIVRVDNNKRPRNITPIELGDSSQVEELEPITIIGHPLSNEWYSRDGRIRSSRDVNFLINIGTIRPDELRGYSGGPLLNQENQLIGIVTGEDPTAVAAIKIHHVLDGLSERVPLPTTRSSPSCLPSLGLSIVPSFGVGHFYNGFKLKDATSHLKGGIYLLLEVSAIAVFRHYNSRYDDSHEEFLKATNVDDIETHYIATKKPFIRRRNALIAGTLVIAVSAIHAALDSKNRFLCNESAMGQTHSGLQLEASRNDFILSYRRRF
jgi:hypothetical protein